MHRIDIRLSDAKTSVDIPDEYWLALIDLCERENTTPIEVVTQLAKLDCKTRLVNRLQVYLTDYFVTASTLPPGFNEEGAVFEHPLNKALDAVAKNEK